MIENFIKHFDAIVLIDINGKIVLKNNQFLKLFSNTIENVHDLEEYFFKYYKSEQIPIFDTIKIRGTFYLIKRKLINQCVLYHFEKYNYYVNVIEKIKKQSTTDELTGCYNKKEFENILKRMLSSFLRYKNF